MNMIGDGFRNRRRSARASVLLPASVVTMSAYQYLEVVNLSPTGAKLRGSPRPDIGKTAMFRLEGLQVLCKVVWAKGDLCGVRFDETIPPRLPASATPDQREARCLASPMSRPPGMGRRDQSVAPFGGPPHRVASRAKQMQPKLLIQVESV